MAVLLLFAFISGLITIAAPCIWPILPVVLSSSASGGKNKALGTTIGIIVSFFLITLTLSYVVKTIPFNPNLLRLFAASILVFLGTVLFFPYLTSKIESFVSNLISGTSLFNRFKKNKDSFSGGLLIGLSLGIIWTPCAGPILATIATLASTRSLNLQIVVVTFVYCIGISIPLFIFVLLGNWFFVRSRFFGKYTQIIQRVFGLVIIITAIAIYTNTDIVIGAKLNDLFPGYAGFLNSLEGNQKVQNELNKLKRTSPTKVEKPSPKIFSSGLPNLGQAPEIVGITNWLNTKKSLTIASLHGKVVLVDFWTYTCINCIRTLPHVTAWYKKYKDMGFVVLGIHTPEFEFEKDTQNVVNAIKQFNIDYPVGQDNNYATWNNYSNLYWPAEYLIDAEGNIRRKHFGEGEYDQTEKAIMDLLSENGKKSVEPFLNLLDQTPHGFISPETYLGSDRLERIANSERISSSFKTYKAPESVPINYYFLAGDWQVLPQYAVSKKGSSLVFHFNADKVYLVMYPPSQRAKIKLTIDGKDLESMIAGSDVIDSIVTIDEPRLYNLIDLKGSLGEHILNIQVQTDGLKFYAFTFG